jgi:hypothetical protein
MNTDDDRELAHLATSIRHCVSEYESAHSSVVFHLIVRRHADLLRRYMSRYDALLRATTYNVEQNSNPLSDKWHRLKDAAIQQLETEYDFVFGKKYAVPLEKAEVQRSAFPSGTWALLGDQPSDEHPPEYLTPVYVLFSGGSGRFVCGHFDGADQIRQVSVGQLWPLRPDS